LRKIIISVFFMFACVSAARADLWAIRSYLEILGEYNIAFNARSEMAVPTAQDRTGTLLSPSLDFNGVFLFGGNDGIFSLYVKKGYIDNTNKTYSLLSASGGGTYLYADEQWGLHYIGIGGRKYFFIDNFSTMQVLPYIGLDLGGYFAAYTISHVTIINSSGFPLASGDMNNIGAFFGANVEAGADFWVTNEIAFTVKGGYRFCNGTTRSEITVDNKVPAPLVNYVNGSNDCKIDYSGFFIQAGINLNFQRYD